MNVVINRLSRVIARLPGLGPRSAQRIALVLCQNKHRETLLQPLIQALSEIEGSIQSCTMCGNLDSCDPCMMCQDQFRDRTVLCIVEEIEDMLAIERTNKYQGLYHILGGTLSALKGVFPEDLHLHNLIERVRKEQTKEVILALNPTPEGQTTSFTIAEMLSEYKNEHFKISQIAHGVPLGGELGYLDEGTLGMALMTRQPF